MLPTTASATRATRSLARHARLPGSACRSGRQLHTSGRACVPAAALAEAEAKAEQPCPQHPRVVERARRGGGQQLNIPAQSYKPAFYDAVAQIMRLREQYIAERALFVRAKDMMPLVLGLGARTEDLQRMSDVGDRLVGDPTLPFRLTRNGRFCVDYGTSSLRRLEFQPFTLTEEEDFKRYDSGEVRRFDEIEDQLQLNSVWQALVVFKAIMIHGVDIAHRPFLDYAANKWVCTLFCVRTFTNAAVLGEPALEGVHSDGVDHTMTTYLKSSNMSSDSAATYFHGMAETTGIHLNQSRPANILGRVQHTALLDTLIIADHERKHSLSAVHPIDKSKEAYRDMLVFFTRKPVESGHVSAGIDSLEPHEELSMEVPLFLPGQFGLGDSG